MTFHAIGLPLVPANVPPERSRKGTIGRFLVFILRKSIQSAF